MPTGRVFRPPSRSRPTARSRRRGLYLYPRLPGWWQSRRVLSPLGVADKARGDRFDPGVRGADTSPALSPTAVGDPPCLASLPACLTLMTSRHAPAGEA